MKRFSGLRIKSNYLCDFRDNPHKTKAILCGGLRGGAVYKKYHKTNNKQYVNRGYDSESGTTYLENPAYGWVFAFLHPDSPSNCVRLFAAQRLTPSGPARHARCSTPAALVRVRAPLFKEPAHKAGFCFSASGLSIELR